ncbi:MAG: hypothetical protein FWH11_12065, partial [Micrococcales bacterium]|nr:hypothetical protein [Micrococcales bacterium]
TAGSNTYEAPPSASATSPTTSPARCWKPEVSDRCYTLDCDEPAYRPQTGYQILQNGTTLTVRVQTKRDAEAWGFSAERILVTTPTFDSEKWLKNWYS